MDDEAPGRRVTVDGRGVVTTAPDAARIAIGVDVAAKTIEEARAEAARQATAAIEAIKGQGIPAADLQTAAYAVVVHRDVSRKGDPTKVLGYGVRTSVLATVRDLARLGLALDAALAVGANRVAGPEFFVAEPGPLEDQARSLAVADARRRASVLAQAAGAALGRVVAISEGEDMGYRPRRMYALRSAAVGDDAATPIEPGTEEIAIEVRVTWELA